jgi:hypothetical protein
MISNGRTNSPAASRSCHSLIIACAWAAGSMALGLSPASLRSDRSWLRAIERLNGLTRRS